MNINGTVTSEWRAENNMQVWRSLNFLAVSSNMTVPRVCTHMLTLSAVVPLRSAACEMSAEYSSSCEIWRQLNCLGPRTRNASSESYVDIATNCCIVYSVLLIC
jgi:hypothetical protein